MANLSDRELDRLSRDAAERFDVDEDIGTWDRLAQSLDSEPGNAPPSSKVPGAPRSPFLFAPALVVLLGITYYLLKPNTHRSTSTLPVQSVIAKEKARQQPADLSQPQNAATKTGKTEAPEQLNKPAAVTGAGTRENKQGSGGALNDDAAAENPGTKNNEEAVGISKLPNAANDLSAENSRKTGTKTNALSKSNTPGHGNPSNTEEKNSAGLSGKREKRNSTATTIGSFPESAARGTRQFSGTKQRTHAGKQHADEFAAGPGNTVKTRGMQEQKNSREKFMVTGGSVHPADGRPYYAKLPLLLLNNSDVAAIDDSALRAYTPPPSPQAETEKKRSVRINRSLQVGILFAPDFSNVRFEYADKAGTNFGITLGYYLTKNLSVNTGLIFAKKNYSALGRDFHPPKNIWLYDDVEFLKGNCRMVEIPLNLRYDFAGSVNTKGFVSAGLSSYLMNDENYRLYFHRFGLVTTKEISNTKQQNYLFSVLNLSGGFETNISNSLSFEVEPFLKLPLSGIGFGNISLSSYGVNFYLKFAPVLSRKKN